MIQKRHALVLFTKAPKPGRTKTRLTQKLGGLLTEYEAALLYKSMMLDVVDISLQAVDMCNKSSNTARERYDFVICCSPESEKGALQAIFEEELSATAAINYIIDQGSSFDEHLNDAYHQLFEQGYCSVVCIGGDMPTILPEFLQRAFQWLHYLGAESDRGAIVIAPCQAAGVSLIGLTSNAPMDFSGVFYNLQGTSALEAITNIAYTKRIPMALLETIADVDLPEDLAHTIAIINAMSYASIFQEHITIPKYTLDWIQQNGMVVRTPPNDAHDPREVL